MSWKLKLEDIDEYKAAFAVIDKDNDGKISAAEMGNIMRTLGKNFSNKEFNAIINEIETKMDGYIELDKFLNLMAENKSDESTIKAEQTNLINAFKYFDRSNCGLINYEEFKHILTTVSEKLTQEELGKLEEICSPHVNSNGMLQYQEVLDLIMLR